jgi:hypothetical protein
MTQETHSTRGEQSTVRYETEVQSLPACSDHGTSGATQPLDKGLRPQEQARPSIGDLPDSRGGPLTSPPTGDPVPPEGGTADNTGGQQEVAGSQRARPSPLNMRKIPAFEGEETLAGSGFGPKHQAWLWPENQEVMTEASKRAADGTTGGKLEALRYCQLISRRTPPWEKSQQGGAI